MLLQDIKWTGLSCTLPQQLCNSAWLEGCSKASRTQLLPNIPYQIQSLEIHSLGLDLGVYTECHDGF